MSDLAHTSPDFRWSFMKLERGFGLLDEVKARTHVWNARELLQAPVRFSADMTAIEIMPTDISVIPIDEWALLIGEALHHGRSALDAAVWELATADGNTPKNRQQISFPITTKPEDWTKRRKELERYLTPEHLDRIEQAQPWAINVPHGGVSYIAALGELDIRDKHHGILKAEATFQAVQIDNMNILWTHPERSMRWRFTATDLDADAITLRPETPIARMQFSEPLNPASTLPPTAPLAASIVTVAGQGTKLTLDDLQELIRHAWAIIDHLKYGGSRFHFDTNPTPNPDTTPTDNPQDEQRSP